MRRKRKHHQAEEQLDRWLVSYADFITLLFAFFVVTYAVSSINEGKYKQVTSSMISAFKTIPKSLEPIQVGEISRSQNNSAIEKPINHSSGDASQTEERNLRKLADRMAMEMVNLIPSDEVTIRRTDDWLEIEINSQILFGSGSAKLMYSATSILSKIARILSDYPNPINVEGFTDNVPISTEDFPSNWELSAARAASVVHLFSKSGIEPSRMSAIAYGEYRPIADNEIEQGRRKNRRVVIAVLAEDLELDKVRH